MMRFIASVAALGAFAVGLPGTGSAGGWVVVSLDSTPAVEAGKDVTIGFTVLRHGVTPESSDDLAIVLTGTDRVEHRFEAVQQGAVGHHVATINVPAEGSYDWSITSSSGFVAAALGTLEVSGSSSGGGSWTWDALQWGSTSLAVVMAGLAVIEFRRSRTEAKAAPVAA
jgi:hypothetical protein